MDLKDVVQNVRDKADEAHSAFHAGHLDNAEHYLAGIRAEIVEYEKCSSLPGEDVAESATSEKLTETLPETPGEVPGAPVQQVPEGPVLPASQFGSDRSVVKPNQ